MHKIDLSVNSHPTRNLSGIGDHALIPFIDSLCKDTIVGPIYVVNYQHNQVPLVCLHMQGNRSNKNPVALFRHDQGTSHGLSMVIIYSASSVIRTPLVWRLCRGVRISEYFG